MGSVWARCPVAAAKTLSEGRLLIGWSSTRVTLLEPRPLRCFSSLRALPNEPKLGPPSSSSSRDNPSPNSYPFWLNTGISETISPRPPVPGLPVEGATRSTPRAGFQWTVSATTETVRNRCGPAWEVGGQLLRKTPPL
ncbi:hypothetical protein ACJJTC_011509 [Scirpophaga incertulas]